MRQTVAEEEQGLRTKFQISISVCKSVYLSTFYLLVAKLVYSGIIVLQALEQPLYVYYCHSMLGLV